MSEKGEYRWVSALWYGAKHENEPEANRAALDEAVADVIKAGGGVVFIPAGQYAFPKGGAV